MLIGKQVARLVAVCLLAVLSCIQSGLAQDLVGSGREERRSGRKLWWLSIAAVAAATMLDVQTSVGKYELNPMFRSRDGIFSPGRGIAIKMGVLGGGAAAQFLLFRREPRIPTALTIANFAAAGVLGGVAVRNSRVPAAISVEPPPAVSAP